MKQALNYKTSQATKSQYKHPANSNFRGQHSDMSTHFRAPKHSAGFSFFLWDVVTNAWHILLWIMCHCHTFGSRFILRVFLTPGLVALPQLFNTPLNLVGVDA